MIVPTLIGQEVAAARLSDLERQAARHAAAAMQDIAAPAPAPHARVSMRALATMLVQRSPGAAPTRASTRSALR